MTSPRPFAEATERNGAPILDVLAHELSAASSVFEIGSGTGQHAARFAAALPELRWQPSDLAANIDGMRAWRAASGVKNILDPLVLDVRDPAPTDARFDAVFSANTAHIMGIDAVRCMFSLAGRLLAPGGRFLLYGPFRQGGRFSTPSNAAFDRSLRERDTEMGIRDLEAMDALATDNGMLAHRLYAMPANNLLRVWLMQGPGSS